MLVPLPIILLLFVGVSVDCVPQLGGTARVIRADLRTENGDAVSSTKIL